MKRLLLSGLFLYFFLGTNPLWALFIDGLEDVPVMEGVEQVQKDSISFGNEESRLVETYLTSSGVSFDKLSKFYRETLPQMGWAYHGMRENTLIFEREGEFLEIAKEENSPLVVRVTVKSKI